MDCTIAGCPGAYEGRTIIHTVRHDGRIVVVDHVPAEVCVACGDVVLRPEVVRQIEAILQMSGRPAVLVPLYEYATSP